MIGLEYDLVNHFLRFDDKADLSNNLIFTTQVAKAFGFFNSKFFFFSQTFSCLIRQKTTRI